MNRRNITRTQKFRLEEILLREAPHPAALRWRVLREELNVMGPPRKTVEQWKKMGDEPHSIPIPLPALTEPKNPDPVQLPHIVSDWKCKVKSMANKLINSISKPGDEQNIISSLTDAERLLSILEAELERQKNLQIKESVQCNLKTNTNTPNIASSKSDDEQKIIPPLVDVEERLINTLEEKVFEVENPLIKQEEPEDIEAPSLQEPSQPTEIIPKIADNTCIKEKRKRTDNDDEFAIFGEYVASELGSLQFDHNKRKLKRMIQKAILDISEIDDNERDSSDKS